MTIHEMELAIRQLQKDVKNLASRPTTARSEAAKVAAHEATKAAEHAADKADGYAEAITDLALSQEELLTEIIPKMIEMED